MMRIEPANTHRRARAHDGAIDIDRQARQRQTLDGLDNQLVVELDQRGEGGPGELTQPVADGPRCRDPRQATEAGDERIAPEIAEVFQSSRPDVEQRQDEQRQSAAAIVAVRACARRAEPAGQLAVPHVARSNSSPLYDVSS
jgi:hypothetical protein